jgi:biotin carboxyl carrier protein
MASQQLHTRWLEAALPELLDASKSIAGHARSTGATGQNHSKPVTDAPAHAIVAPMPARLVQLSVAEGDEVPAGAELAVLEAMKMEHVLAAPHAGRVTRLLAVPGGYLGQGQPLLVLEPIAGEAHVRADDATAHDPGRIRADLQRVLDRHAFTLDAARPEAMARRHAQGSRSARENMADLCDEGSFIEYGALAIAAQTRRRSMDDLIANTPADGMVTGIGGVNGAIFGPRPRAPW